MSARIKKSHIESNKENDSIYESQTKTSKKKQLRENEKNFIEGIISSGTIGSTEKEIKFQESFDV